MEATELCPWCNSVISRDSFLEIEARIRTEEKKKLTTKEAIIRETLKNQFAADYEKRQQVIERKLKAESEITLTKLTAERDAAARRLKDAEGRELEIRKQAKAEADKSVAKELERRNRALEKAIVERDAANQSAKNAEAREAQIRKEVRLEAEKAALKERHKDRETLAKENDLALLKQKAESNRKLDALQKQLKIMERKVQNKTANQLGDGAEIDLYEALRESFPEDRVTRVPKGQNGADLIHEVKYKGQSCGRIVIDSKNHQGWQYGFVSKLRDDQLAAGADHAILSSSAFPEGKKEMCVESDVIVISPARITYVVQLLRKSIISMYVQGLSLKEKADKTSRLYKLVTSDSYMRRFNEAVKVGEDILELDVAEQNAHRTVWRNRGALTKRMGNLLREIDTDVAAVIEGSQDGNVDVPVQSKPPIVSKPVQRQEAI